MIPGAWGPCHFGSIHIPAHIEISPSGPQRLIFFRARFPDDTQDPVSEEKADRTLAEVDETITGNVAYPSTATRLGQKGNLVTVYYPGRELAEINGQLNWVLTEPSYVPGAGSSATVTIQDDDPNNAQVVSVTALYSLL